MLLTLLKVLTPTLLALMPNWVMMMTLMRMLHQLLLMENGRNQQPKTATHFHSLQVLV